MPHHPDLAQPWPTSRLCLRRLSEADLAQFASYRSDAELARYQGWTPMTPEAALQFLTTMRTAPAFPVGAWFQWGIAALHDDHLLGDLGVFRHDAHTAEVGFTLARSAHGQGFAREAVSGLLEVLFTRTETTRIIGVTDARNTPSVNVLRAVGMQQTREEQTVFRGEPCVEWTFECTKPSVER